MKKELGQFMTINEKLQEKVIDFIKNKPSKVLEPSVGMGHLIVKLNERYPLIDYDCYEIDDTLDFLIDNITISNFLEENLSLKYQTIIGNPPYVKTKNGNLYLKFIEKCFNLLESNGELIFIIPSDFFKLTSASNLLTLMYENGCFTHIYHPDSETLFEDANVNILIFRYCLNKQLKKICSYNDSKKNILIKNGIISFVDKIPNNTKTIGDLFECSVGLVTGKENVFKNNIGNVEILTDFDKIEKYILIDEYPCGVKEIDDILLKNKKDLIERRIRKFNENNWYEWGALRNYQKMKKNIGKPCIYVKNLTRDKIIAWVGEVNFFGAKLIMLLPKKEINLDDICKKINQKRNDHLYSGRFKIGHKELENLFIYN